MERHRLVPGPEHQGATVQRLLHDRLRVSNAQARGIVDAGLVSRNAAPVRRADERVALGDAVEVLLEPGRRYHERPAHRDGIGYRIVLEDADLLVIDKEAGLLTVPASTRGEPSLLERLEDTRRRRGFRRPELHVVHRIDRYTSGLVVFARTRRALDALKAQFAAGTPERIYLAVAEGRLEHDRGRLVHRLAEHPGSLKVQVVTGRHPGRQAASRFRVLDRFEDATFLEVRLETGRRNQIRVQLASEGHPLVGDASYGRPSRLIGRTALHAHRLAFEHPAGERVELVSPPPDDFQRLLARLRRGARAAEAALEP